MKTHWALSVVVMAVAAAVGGCCGTPRETGESMLAPEGAAVETAGWESHPAAPWASGAAPAKAASAPSEVESLRAMNRQLMDQVSRLRTDVQALKEPAAAPAAAAESSAPPTAGSVELASVRSALQKSGAGEMSASLSPEGEVCLTVPGSLCFASGRADLQAAAQEKLRKVFASLKAEYPKLKVRVEGHTDADPIRKSKWESNQALSDARAKAVAAYLVSGAGLNPEQVDSLGCGATKPVASNDTPAGKAENRRVEIYLIP